jgi:SAM-dependent methyltransferase
MLKDVSFYLAGLGFLGLAKVKHTLQGYNRPTPFADDAERSIAHVRGNAERLANAIERSGKSLQGTDILELGPGSSLEGGRYLLTRGAASYTAFDRFRLAPDLPGVRYIVRDDFDLSTLPPASFDLIVSCAAFEHFDDVDQVIRQLTALVRPNGMLCAEIDLQTHSRWIREADPNNIYRYSEWLYRLFYFPGQPNRMRPYQYRDLMAKYGWSEIRTEPSHTFRHSGRAHSRFRDGRNEMDLLSFLLIARRAP